MSLTIDEERQASVNAERRYAAAHPEATSSAGMVHDPQFRQFFCEEVAAIEASHTRPTVLSGARCDSATSTCPLAQKDTNHTVNCNFNSLTVNKENDSNRVYRSTSHDRNVLELVAGRNRAKATVQLRAAGVSIQCDEHNHRVWNVSPVVSGATLNNNDSLDLSLGWAGDTSELGFFNHNIQPTVYHVVISTHNRSQDIRVKIYPDYAWEGSASVNFRVEGRSIHYDGLSIQLQRTDDNVTTQYGGRIQEIIDLLCRYFMFILTVKDIAQRVTAGAFTWSLVPPCFAITIGSRWQENTTNLLCGYYYNLRLAFNPLVGIQLVINLGIIAIQAIPYIGTLVARMAGEEITRYIAVTFTLSGTIGCDITASKNSTDSSGTVNGGITGQVGFDFQVRGQINRDMTFMAINCGIRGGARATVTATLRGPVIDRSGSYISLGANFDGLTLYAAAYCRMGSSQTTRQATTTAPAYETGHIGEGGTYAVRNVSPQLGAETNREQAGGAGETAYLWIEQRELGTHRFNLH